MQPRFFLLLTAGQLLAQKPPAERRANRPLEYCATTLSLAKPRAVFPAAPVQGSNVPHIVAIPLTRIVNPAMVGFSISLDLQAQGKQIVHVGSVGPFPADRPGAFNLRVNTALEKLRAFPAAPASRRSYSR